MIDRQGDIIVFACDSCQETAEQDASGDGFQGAWAIAKRDGWSTKKIGKEWIHSCPDCGPAR